MANYDQERYVDVTSETVAGLHYARIDLAHSIGCDGVDPDNIDTYVGLNSILMCRYGTAGTDDHDRNSTQMNQLENKSLKTI